MLHLAVQRDILQLCSYQVSFQMLCVISLLLCNFVINCERSADTDTILYRVIPYHFKARHDLIYEKAPLNPTGRPVMMHPPTSIIIFHCIHKMTVT